MKKVFTMVLLFVFSNFTAFAKEVNYFSIKVTKIVDGDTLHGTYYDYPVKVRLYGIDSPEKRQAFSNKATEKLAELIKVGEEIVIKVINYDTYGRAVSIIELKNEKSVQSELLESGYAWIYPRYCKENICSSWQEIEDTAKSDKVGLWTEKSPIPPWEFRKK